MNQNPAISQNAQNAQNPQQPQQQQPKKKARETITLKPEHFQKKTGFQTLYKSIQKLDLNKAQSNIQATMDKIIVVLKSWQYQMIPKYDFDYFLQRCRALGNHKFTQAYMAKVRRIHKGDDTWANEINQFEALNNVNLDHLNPNDAQKNLQQGQQESLDKKIERAMKIVNETENRQYKIMNQNNNRKMEVQSQQMRDFEAQLNEESDDECDDLLKQMQLLEKQKKELLSNKKERSKMNEKQMKKQMGNQESEEQPYVPQGFEIDYGQQSSYND